jgi:hypothetical protein
VIVEFFALAKYQDCRVSRILSLYTREYVVVTIGSDHSRAVIEQWERVFGLAEGDRKRCLADLKLDAL